MVTCFRHVLKRHCFLVLCSSTILSYKDIATTANAFSRYLFQVTYPPFIVLISTFVNIETRMHSRFICLFGHSLRYIRINRSAKKRLRFEVSLNALSSLLRCILSPNRTMVSRHISLFPAPFVFPIQIDLSASLYPPSSFSYLQFYSQ